MPADFLSGIGVRVPELVSGFAGGLVKILFTRGARPAELIASAIGGALTSNYLSETFSHLVGKAIGEGLDLGVAGFVVGLTAMTICQKVIVVVGDWVNRFSAKPTGGTGDV